MLTYITLLLLCQLIGEVLVRLADLPLPGPVAGMAILFLGLVIRGRIPDGLDQVSRGLLGHLALLFVPASVGVMVHLDEIGREALPIAGAVLGSTVLTLVITGRIMQALNRRRGDKS
jgi:putative effector of murein hydrolase LrgA (UPF0299 family)